MGGLSAINITHGAALRYHGRIDRSIDGLQEMQEPMQVAAFRGEKQEHATSLP